MIRNLRSGSYQAEEIASLLAFFYKYSMISNNEVISTYTLQPHVSLHQDMNGKYLLAYETFNEKHIEDMRYINDWRYIYYPIEFVEKPCSVPMDERGIEIDNIFTFEQCDQYAAFRKMAEESTNEPKTTTVAGTSRQRVTTTVISKGTPSRSVLSRQYLLGFYYLGVSGATVHTLYGP